MYVSLVVCTGYEGEGLRCRLPTSRRGWGWGGDQPFDIEAHGGGLGPQQTRERREFNSRFDRREVEYPNSTEERSIMQSQAEEV